MDKNFSDFISTLTPDVYVEIAESVNMCKIKIGNPATDNSAISFPNGIASVDIIITLELLKRYHEWLKS